MAECAIDAHTRHTQRRGHRARATLVAMSCAVAIAHGAAANDGATKPADAASAVAPFAGRWELDRDASEAVDTLLEWRGQSWLRRKAAAAMSITLVLEARPGELHEAMESTLVSRSRDYPLDDTWRSAVDELGTEIEVRSRVDGAAIVHESKLPLADGTPAVVRVRRELDAGRTTLVQTLGVEAEDGRRFSAKRVLRRAAK